MNPEYHSLPDALASELKQLATDLVAHQPQSTELSIGERLSQPLQQVEPAINRALLQIAQASPELLASMILAQLGVTAVEVMESEEHREDRLVEQRNGNYHYTDVEPFTTRKTITRSVRLLKDAQTTNGRRR
ncbi:MAG: hypothetical protein IT205_09960 [Fimbriimonadaceae bacterium]|nr:hypothetical protein [Fimbriimonadaceae bacterium]